METLVLKNINMLTKEQFDGVENPAPDELYAVSSSGFGKPSDRYIDLSLGASGSTYTAPADGFVTAGGHSTVTGGYFELYHLQLNFTFQSAASTGYGRGFIPVKKGIPFLVNYNAFNFQHFRFIFDEGEI